MAAAVELAQRGIAAEVFEAAPVLGGRARAARISGVGVDCGQHILLGAYRETLRLLRLLDAPAEQLLRLPLELVFPGEFSLRARALPAPLHIASALLFARGLSLTDKWAALRFMRHLQRRQFRLAADCSVTALLEAQGQGPRLSRYLWQPLCLAALNTPPERASAQIFANVLRDSLSAGSAASDMLLPRVDLCALFPARAEAFINARGGAVRRRTRVCAIVRHGDAFALSASEATLGVYRQVIVAVAPWHAGPLFAALPALDGLRQQLQELRAEPIITCYLNYGPSFRLPLPMLGRAGGYLQWLFDRGQLGGPAGLMAAVISGPGRHQQMTDGELAAQLHAEIAAMLAKLGRRIVAPRWTKLIREQRATFACSPGLARPGSRTAIAGLLLAGDYVASDYPATLETAVRSGVAAARLASGLEAAADQP